MLDNLTIVIITYNRYSFLLRLLNFYKNFNTSAKILILDSSDHEPINFELIELLGSSSILWKKYDPKIFFTAKIADGIKYVNTKYAVLAADDDFLFPDSLSRCIEFMEINLDYASCHGLYYQHYPMKFFGYKTLGLAPLYESGIGADDPRWESRVLNYMNGVSEYYPMYAVHRSGDFRLMWEHGNKCILDWGISELAPCMISLIIGKMGILDIPYASREPNFNEWFDHKRHHEMYSEEKLQLASRQIAIFISMLRNVNYDEAYSIINESIQSYVERTFSKNRVYNSFFRELRLSLKVKLRLKAIKRLKTIGCKNYDSLKSALFFKNISQVELDSSRAMYSKYNNQG